MTNAQHVVNALYTSGTYALHVPEDRVRLEQAAADALPAGQGAAVRAAVRALVDQPTASATSVVHLAVDEAGEHMAFTDWERAIDAETDRVLDDITGKLKAMVADGSFTEYSSPETGEWYAVVCVQYAAAAAAAVEHEVQQLFCREYAVQHPQRPWFRWFKRYNVFSPLSVQPRRVFCTAFFFEWADDPRRAVGAPKHE